jgi:PAS domain S-box-containing protein
MDVSSTNGAQSGPEQRLLARMTDAHIVLDGEFRVIYANPAAERVLGVSKESFLGRTHWEAWPASAGTVVEREYRRVVAERADAHFTHHYVGEQYDVHLEIDAYPTDEGGVAVFWRDVTRRVRTETALRESEARLRRVAGSGIVGLFFWAVSGGVTEANDAFLAMLGYTQDDLAAGRVDWRAMTPPEYADGDEAALRELLATGRHGQYAKEYVAADGRRVPVLIQSAFLDGSRTHGVCVCLDDPARRAAERAVREQYELLRSVLAATDDLVFAKDRDGRYVVMNDAGARLHGRAAAEVVGRTDAELFAPALAAELRANDLAVMAEGTTRRFEERTLVGGEPVTYLSTKTVYRDAAGAVGGVVGVSTDITDRKRAEAARDRALARTTRLQAVTAALSEALTREDVARVVATQGAAALGAHGGSVALLRPPTTLALVEAWGLPPEVVAAWREFPADAAVPIADAVRTAEPVLLESLDAQRARYPALAALPHTAAHPALAVVPLVSAGRAVGALTLSYAEPREFSADEQAFMRALGAQAALALERARLFEAEREARAAADAASRAKSDFLASMSHELRTPLNAVLGYAELMTLGISGPVTDAQRDQLERIQASGRHLVGMVSEILDLAKIEAGAFAVAHEPASAADAVAAAVALVRPQGAARRLTLDVDAGDVRYVGDEQRVRQILVNLLSNAVKFTPPGGRVTVRAGLATGAPHADARDGAAWGWVAVSDTGIGIAPESLERIFRPFVQADEGHTRAYGGTGLGLAISRRLAELMGGTLTVRSAPGVGSTFTVWLPADALPAPPRPAPPASPPPAGDAPDAQLAATAHALLAGADAVAEAYVARLRCDPALPGAHGLDDLRLRDHVSTLLADLSQTLLTIADTAGRAERRAELLRDGTEIQRVVAERHGVQRHRLGWREAEVAHEYALLRAEVERVVGVRAAPDGGPAAEILGRLLHQAEAVSRQALRQAAQTDA